MKIIVGLGNYGDKYAYTFHNMGFLAAEALADKLSLDFCYRECDASVAKGETEHGFVVIARPLTYMNLSGIAVKKLLQKYKATLGDLIVFCDDIDIERGKIRIRMKGSGGTHNGLKNIISVMGSGDFCRVRIGIGRSERAEDLADYVLSEVKKSDRPLLAEAIELGTEEVIKLIKNDK
jgi:PTH1 family peptidyl-tRNA hydrolase